MAIAPIIVRFASAGVPEVSAAFAQVRTQAAKFEDGMVSAAEKGGRARVSLADREAREKMRAADKVAKEAEKTEREKTRLEEREAKRRGEIGRRSSEMAGREAVKAAREEAKEIERIEEQKMRMRIRSSEMAGRAAAHEAAEEIKLRERAAAASGKALSKGGVGYANKWGGRIGGAASLAAGVVGIGGAFALADAGKKEFSDERNAAQLVNLVTSGTKAPDGANVQNILGQAGAVSRETGIDRGEIVEASKTYAKNAQHGDFKGVMGNMGLFAKLAKVTGADMGTIAEAAGTLQSQNPDLGPDQMKQMLLDANEMSKQGKMSFSESLAQMGKVGSTRSSYAGNVANNQRTLIGYAQLVKSGGTAEEVGTFTSALAAESTAANKKFKEKNPGKELFKTDQFGRIASPDTLVEDVLRNTHGNIQEINSLMGRRGGALFREVEQSYIQGAGKGNNVEAGIKSVKSYMGEVTGARGTEEGLNAQFAQTMSQPAEKFGTAMNKIQEEMMEQLAPALASFADKLSDPAVQRDIGMLIDGIGKLADFLIKNPLAGIGNIIAIAVTKDILDAAIGATIKRIMAAAMGGMGGGAGGGIGAGAGVLGKIGSGVAIAAGAIAVTTAGMTAIDAYNAEKRDASGREIGSALGGVTDAAALARKAKNKTVTPEDIAKMAAAAEAQKKVVDEKEAAMKSGPGAFASLIGAGDNVAADQKAQYALQKSAFDDMVRSIKEASAALAGMKNNVPTAVPPVTAGAPQVPIGHTVRG